MIDLSKLGDSPVAMLGVGASGQATITALRHAGITVYAWDDHAPGRTTASALGAVTCELDDDVLKQCRMLVMSPGIPTQFPAPHPVVARAQKLQLKILCDIDLLWRMAPDATYVAITGTNGKSTTTALIGHILQACGRNVAMGGNLGPAALSLPMLEKPSDIYLLELSSYQLELCPIARFDHTVFLNLTPDHLDRYKNMASYAAAKMNILRPRNDGRPQTAIMGLDTPETARIMSEQSGLSARDFIPISGHERCLSGVSIVGRILHDDINNLRFDLTTALALPGPHNGQNAAAAYAVCLQLGLQPQEIIFNLLNFPGLEHRQKYVTTIDGVDIVNDSKATNADAAAKALACYDNIYWIAGGRPKPGADYNVIKSFTSRIQGAYLIGEAASEIAEWCRVNGIPSTPSGTIDKALRDALYEAKLDRRRPVTVLLSPACASFDQFQNFEDRGRQFTAMALTFAAQAKGQA
jgi:UDP-N-acetylmuramoylalanine--D-glutamate ligase